MREIGREREIVRVFVRDNRHTEERRMATKIQDPHSNPNATTAKPSSTLFIRGGGGNGTSAAPFAGDSHSHHRRSHSEVNYRLPDDMMGLSPPDPLNGGSSTASLEEIGSEDDLFSTYIDVEKLGGATDGSGRGGNGSDQSGYCNGVAGTSGHNDGEKSPSAAVQRPRHRHSSSVDCSTSTSMFGEIMEAKKAMPPDKLAELWAIDPKRAKRFSILAFSFSQFIFIENALSSFDFHLCVQIQNAMDQR